MVGVQSVNLGESIKEIDTEFYKLQENMSFFIFEIVFSLYLLLNLGLIAEKFLMPSLMNISRRYNMSRDLTGILVALGNLVPELTTTILSFLKHGVKMTEFGVACNVGTSVFVVTVVPAVAMFITASKSSQKSDKSKSKNNTSAGQTPEVKNSLNKKNEPNTLKEMNQDQDNEVSRYQDEDDDLDIDEHKSLISQVKEITSLKIQNRGQQQMMRTIYRDMGFFIFALLIYDIVLYKGIIYLHEAFGLLALVIVYLWIIFKMEKNTESEMRQDTLHASTTPPKDKNCPVKFLQSKDSQQSLSINKSVTKDQDSVSSKSYSKELESLEKESKVLHYLELACYPALKTLNFILPVEKLPILAFLLIVVIFFISMDFILTVVSVLSIYSHMTSLMIGLTIISWGSSPIELINLIIASKKNELQIGMTSILSGIVFTFFTLMPLAMIFKMIKKQRHEIEILQPLHSSHLVFMPALIVICITTIVYYKTQMNIGKQSGGLLIICYLAYLTYMFLELKNDKY
eukprot:403347382